MRIAPLPTGSPVWLAAPEDVVVPTAVADPVQAQPTPPSERGPSSLTPVPGAGPVGETPRESLPPAFDPPLIAQRALLGWPVGPMIAEYARAEGTSYTAAHARVQAASAVLEQRAAR